MIVGIGCDIVDHDTIEDSDWPSDESQRLTVFSAKENALFHRRNSTTFLAGRFAVKEAVLKCFGTGMYDGIAMTDIHVLSGENDQPYVELSGSVKRVADELRITQWHVSISHASRFSCAYVIAESQS